MVSPREAGRCWLDNQVTLPDGTVLPIQSRFTCDGLGGCRTACTRNSHCSQLTGTAHGLAKGGFGGGLAFRPLWDAIEAEALRQLCHYSPREVATTVWSYAKVGLGPSYPALFASLELEGDGVAPDRAADVAQHVVRDPRAVAVLALRRDPKALGPVVARAVQSRVQRRVLRSSAASSSASSAAAASSAPARRLVVFRVLGLDRDPPRRHGRARESFVRLVARLANRRRERRELDGHLWSASGRLELQALLPA